MNDRRLVRGAALLVALAAIGATLYFSPFGQNFDAARLAETARSMGSRWWALPLFVLAYIVLDLLFIPTQFLSIAAVLIWGWFWGATIELASATIGAIPPYLIARSTLREWVEGRLRGQRRIAEAMERDPFTLMLILRVVPIVPYTLLNYLAGLSPIRLHQYTLATLIGMVPSCYIFAFFVQAVLDGVMEPRQIALRALAAGALFGAMIIATRLAAPRVRRRFDASSSRTSSPPASADRD